MSSDPPVGVPGVPAHSIEVPPPHDANPRELHSAALQLEHCASDLGGVSARLGVTLTDLTLGGGQWQGPVADAFLSQAWEPIKRTLVNLGSAFEDAAHSLRRAATALEDAQSDRRRAEALAVAAGVGVALTVLTFGISDAAAAEAAVGAAALMARAAMSAASAMRMVVLALEDAGAAVRALSVTMRTWGTSAAYAVSVTVPRLALSPVGMGGLGAAGTASLGDTRPTDLIQAFAMGYLEGKAAGVSGSDVAEQGGEEAGAAASSRARSAVMPPLDELAAAAERLDPAGGGALTYAGRAVAKHGARPGSVLPQPRGRPDTLNTEGQRIVEEILHDPKATITTGYKPRYGHYMDIRSSRGLGIRYTASGRFIGFLEP